MSKPDKPMRENLVVPGHAEHMTLPSMSTVNVPIQRAMPGITILVHGVNDIGEAYAAQEQGLCAGLNTRLYRRDLQPAAYEMPPPPIDGKHYQAADIHPDPDKVYYQRKPEAGTSPVIPFYWGFREESDLADTHQKHGQYLDRHGNRLDKRYGKNGGAFANATNNIPDMFGKGFDANVVIRLADRKKSSHPLLNAPPRSYMVLAAQRLACLLRLIRKQSPQEPINIVAHSQGGLITLLAHAMLAKENSASPVKADTVILNNTPYSLETPLFEGTQTGAEQQTKLARETTLQQIIGEYLTKDPAVKPAFSELKKEGHVTGKQWQHDANGERDNRGKVYLYFSPDDTVVGLPIIEGIGCWGVDDYLLGKLGKRFLQRMFASTKGANPKAPQVGAKPQRFNVEFLRNVMPTNDRKRHLNAEALSVPFTPDLGPATLANGPIDAAIAVASPYTKKGSEGMLPGERTEEAQARWMNKSEDNSYHSSIVSNAMHSEMATAYDLCIGTSEILKDNNLEWIEFLRAVADWRTNWRGSNTKEANDASFPPPPIYVVERLDKIDVLEKNIITGNDDYYNHKKTAGVLPNSTSKFSLMSLAPYIMSETFSKKDEKQFQ